MKQTLATLLLLTMGAFAQPITLAWDKSEAADGAGISNYVLEIAKKRNAFTLHYATNSGSTKTELTIDLPTSYNYQARVYAIDSDGLQSLPSEEISFVWDKKAKVWKMR